MVSDLCNELLKNATPRFEIYKRLTANCPKCGSQLVLKYRSKESDARRLSVIMACSNDCDKPIWNKHVEKGFTHWWLDVIMQREGYDEIINSLPTEESKIIRELEQCVRKLNIQYRKHSS